MRIFPILILLILTCCGEVFAQSKYLKVFERGGRLFACTNENAEYRTVLPYCDSTGGYYTSLDSIECKDTRLIFDLEGNPRYFECKGE